MAVKLITDSTAYIEAADLERLDITVVPLSVNFPDVSFRENEVNNEYFYHKMAESRSIPTSSQPSQGEILHAFEKVVSRGDKVLAIFLSSHMSGTYSTALGARKMLLEKYPQAVIEVMDSRSNSMALGLPVLEAARAAQAGRPLSALVEMAARMIKNMNFYFVPETLDYLRKGGRIGGATAFIGSLLHMKPILFVEQGRVALLERVRGSRAGVERLLAILDKAYNRHGLRHVVVHHINAPEKGQEMAWQIMSRYGIEASICNIGPVIGLHVGPGTVGLVFCTES
ncbi:MAG: DegV family protein [Firmicutes bacterium]|nr:DegV family protein [Bacillota bacterium]